MEKGVNNRVRISGEIEDTVKYSHSIYGEGFYTFMLGVKRLSGVKDVLPVTVSERLLTGHFAGPGKLVAVTGQLRSYNKNVDGVNRLILTVFAQELCPCAENENKIELTGFVCKPPVYRTTPFSREISDLLLAVNRAYGKSDYIPCIAWGRYARLTRGLVVGQRVMATGRIQSRVYQKTLDTSQTIERVAYEVSLSCLTWEE